MTQLPKKVQWFSILFFLLWGTGLLYVLLQPEGELIFWLQSHVRSPSLDIVFRYANYWPDEWTIVIVGIFYLIFKPYRFFVLLSNVILILPFTYALKVFYSKARPIEEMGGNMALLFSKDPSFFASDSMSFPSGHATSALALSVFCLLESRFRNKFWGILFCLLACLASLSRVYLGHHYMSDVLAGSCIGFLFSIVITLWVEGKIPISWKNWSWA
jgi:membrane-associated phospholipid phosphatase